MEEQTCDDRYRDAKHAEQGRPHDGMSRRRAMYSTVLHIRKSGVQKRILPAAI